MMDALDLSLTATPQASTASRWIQANTLFFFQLSDVFYHAISNSSFCSYQ